MEVKFKRQNKVYYWNIFIKNKAVIEAHEMKVKRDKFGLENFTFCKASLASRFIALCGFCIKKIFYNVLWLFN